MAEVAHVLEPSGLPTSPRICGRTDGYGVLFAKNATCPDCLAMVAPLDDRAPESLLAVGRRPGGED